MKSRPEYRTVFSSASACYRALHIISTQRYRLPVRRYILDLFTIELSVDVAHTLSECAITLQAPPSFKPPNASSSRVSIFGRLGRSRRPSESDEDEGELDAIEGQAIVTRERPAISLRPVNVITGFAA
jgi:rapamycin-insensitive companion of mTOR